MVLLRQAQQHKGPHEAPWPSMLPILSANGCLLWPHPPGAGRADITHHAPRPPHPPLRGKRGRRPKGSSWREEKKRKKNQGGDRGFVKDQGQERNVDTGGCQSHVNPTYPSSYITLSRSF